MTEVTARQKGLRHSEKPAQAAFNSIIALDN
jgi:hypothetical protein